MALTLTEGNKYSTTELQKAVVDRLTQDSVVLQMMPFEEIMGNSLTYNTITTDSSAQFYSVGDTWVESTPVMTQATAALTILGKDADLDNFILKTRSNIQDVKSIVLDNAVKAVQYKYLDTFFYGDDSSDTKSFDGLHVLMTSTTYNTVHAGSGTGSALSVAKLRAAIDLVYGFKPKVILMSKTMRRLISVYLDSIGSAFPRGVSEWGQNVEFFDRIPIEVDDHILNTETAASGAYTASTGSTNTSIFVLSFDPLACCGIHSGDKVAVEPLGTLETKDASRWRIKWYCGLKLEDIRSCAKVDGIAAGSAVTA